LITYCTKNRKFTKEILQLETLMDKWIDFLKFARSLTQIPEKMDNIPEIHRAFEIANKANLTRAEIEDLERREQFIYDQQGEISLGQQEGLEQGLEHIAKSNRSDSPIELDLTAGRDRICVNICDRP
jgi:predicted transposase/invertase (TIGR01784 family)